MEEAESLLISRLFRPWRQEESVEVTVRSSFLLTFGNYMLLSENTALHDAQVWRSNSRGTRRRGQLTRRILALDLGLDELRALDAWLTR